MAKVLMKGNEAIAEAAIKAGCRYFFGYPITPQNEIPAYMAKMLPKVGGSFIQAESEVSAINMVYGAAGAGARVMTSSSSPGISLKQEGISYIVGAELPCLIVNIVRGGPGLGGIQPAQSDYFQAVKGGGHGDYHMVVLAPASVQEMADLVMDGFDIADRYRNPVMVLGDGMLGQMMEPVEFQEKDILQPQKPWATTGNRDGEARRIINSLFIDPQGLEEHVLKLYKKYEAMKENETRVECYNCENAEIIIVAYGTTARIAKNVIQLAAQEGINLGLIRPVTLWPFPDKTIGKWAKKSHTKGFLTLEMSMGQMVEDVRLSVNGTKPVYFYGRTGGMVPMPRAVLEEIKKIREGI
ncbi:MAG TPA: 3-methyl-2-oxobutanoate dehydrogenase subunit VorB [Clostridia bacterium]|nr:3-methyl-2-oxobutanoate dehydrogenase subunit VorB [Clostridia bacterium]